MWKLPSTNDYSYLESYSVDSVAPVSFLVMVLRYWGQLLIWISLVCACMLSHLSCIRLCKTLWTVACQTPLSMGFSRQEYWKGLPCPLPEDLSDPEIEPLSLISPALAGGFFTTSATWEALNLEEETQYTRSSEVVNQEVTLKPDCLVWITVSLNLILCDSRQIA